MLIHLLLQLGWESPLHISETLTVSDVEEMVLMADYMMHVMAMSSGSLLLMLQIMLQSMN